MPTDSIRWVQRNLPRRTRVVEDLGVQACRRKRGQFARGSDAWSEHAWGNGWDPRIPAGDVGQVTAWLEAQPQVARVLHYGGGRLHISGAPLRNPDGNRVPPCAGGPPSSADGTSRADPAVGIPGLPDLPGVPDSGDAVSALARRLVSALAGLTGAESVGDLARRAGLAAAGLVLLVVAGVALAGGAAR